MKILGTAFRNILRRVRRDGLLPTLRSAWNTLRPATFYVYRLKNPPLPTVPSPEVTVRRGLLTLRDARATGVLLPDEFYYDSKPAYRDCMVAWRGERPVGIIWLLRGPLDTPHAILSPVDAELAGLYVLHEYRGRGIARSLIAQACQTLLAEGIRNIYAVIELHNYSSQKSFTATGFERCGLWRRVSRWGPRWRPVSDPGVRAGCGADPAFGSPCHEVGPFEDSHSGSVVRSRHS